MRRFSELALDVGSRLYNWLGEGVKRFVRSWRRFDAHVNQPMPEGRKWFWTWLGPDGYAWFAPALAISLITSLALGPTVETTPANIGLLALGLVLLLFLHIGVRYSPWLHEHLLAGQLAIFGLLAAILAYFSVPETFSDDSESLHLHVCVAIVVTLITSLGLVWMLARGLFRPAAYDNLDAFLPEIELFAPKDRYDFMGREPVVALLSAWFVVPVRYAVELLLPGSLFALFVPDRYLLAVFLLAGLATWSALFLGTLFDRLMEVLKTVGRLFFIGPQYAVSVAVIAVAMLRLFEVHYITYLFNAGSGGYGNTSIMIYVLITYVAAWYYAYWSDVFLARRVIRLLNNTYGRAAPVQVAYPYHGKKNVSPVKPEGRTIAQHGAGRLKIQGDYEADYDADGPALQFQTPLELLSCFRSQLETSAQTKTRGSDVLAGLRNLQRSALVYPVITSTLAFLILGMPAWLAFTASVQPPELLIRETSPAEINLASLLTSGIGKTGECPPLGTDAPRIAVVASGGGTRAAIYTASVLRGLAEQGKICNVVLASGVSGGSAALAYFALHERELRRSGPIDEQASKAWDRFAETMALPFIEYVLDGASDMRIAFGRRSWRNFACDEPAEPEGNVTGWLPARSRFGNILAEAFVCKMGAGKMSDPSFGLMLNTAMLGSFDAGSRSCDGKELSLAEHASKCRDALDGSSAGGRLVLTNLPVPPQPAPVGNSDPVLQIVTLNDASMSIARAAALSANFPPVFSDAAIDVLPADGGAGKRYWVTDGGAVENRGAMTLYLAIRETVNWTIAPPPLPPLHIVVADVSAAAGNYEESFGFGSVLGAGGQLGLGMEGEVLSDIRDIYCNLGSTVTVHEITMPPVLRNGGIGTHWLLPGTLTFREPVSDGGRVTLTAADVKKVVISLHSNQSLKFENAADAETLLGWARSDPQSLHQVKWPELVAALSRAASASPATTCRNYFEGGVSYVQ
ncbi:hypothetical protein [Mesorhizobium sp. M0296]|uniref:hypothetical protein n=1 Tax=Mesorhizobium sp. M0296 TaxID=2956931 RepID=UPI0033360F1D